MVGLAVVLVVITACSPLNLDWQSRLFDSGHGSATTDNVLTATDVGALTTKWRLTPPACPGGASGGAWYATPVTFKGVIYVGSAKGCLFAINEATGTVKWSKFTAFQPQQTCTQQLGIVASVSVVDDGHGNPLLYFHSSDGYLYKLNGTDGSQIWRALVQIPSPTANDVFAWSSPTVANGKVIVGIASNCDTPFTQGQVRAYDVGTGRLLWAHKTIPDGFTGAGDWYDAAVDGAGDVYVSTGSVTPETETAHPNTTAGFEQYSVLKLNGSTGALIWKAPAPVPATGDSDYASSPVLFTGGGVGMVGATNKDGWFRAYRRDTGAEVWQALVGTAGADGASMPAAGGVWNGSHLYVISNATHTGGQWTRSGITWTPVGGVAAAGSIRELNPADGSLAIVGGKPFELALPSNIRGPCTINGNSLMVCAGGHSGGRSPITTTDCSSSIRPRPPRCSVTSRTRATTASSRNRPKNMVRSSRPTPTHWSSGPHSACTFDPSGESESVYAPDTSPKQARSSVAASTVIPGGPTRHEPTIPGRPRPADGRTAAVAIQRRPPGRARRAWRAAAARR